MLSKLITKLTIFALRNKRLKGEQKAQITSELLKNLHAIPYKDILQTLQDGSVMINGKRMDIDTARMFRDSCIALRDNFARKIIHDQVLFEATKIGVHQANSQDAITFSKSAIWNQNEENILINGLLN